MNAYDSSGYHLLYFHYVRSAAIMQQTCDGFSKACPEWEEWVGVFTSGLCEYRGGEKYVVLHYASFFHLEDALAALIVLTCHAGCMRRDHVCVPEAYERICSTNISGRDCPAQRGALYVSTELQSVDDTLWPLS